MAPTRPLDHTTRIEALESQVKTLIGLFSEHAVRLDLQRDAIEALEAADPHLMGRTHEERIRSLEAVVNMLEQKGKV
jgi:hypothetical protein